MRFIYWVLETHLEYDETQQGRDVFRSKGTTSIPNWVEITKHCVCSQIPQIYAFLAIYQFNKLLCIPVMILFEYLVSRQYYLVCAGKINACLSKEVQLIRFPLETRSQRCFYYRGDKKEEVSE